MPLFSDGLNPTRAGVAHFPCRASSSRLVPRRLARLSLCQSSPNPASPFFLAFQPPRVFFQPPMVAPFLGRDLCSSSTAVIRPPFRALFDPNVIQSQRPWNSGLWDKVMRSSCYTEDAIPDVDKVQWKKIDAQLCSDMDLSTYIGRIASLKKEFLTLIPFTNGAEAQQIQTDKFFMVLTLIGLRPDLESVRDQILASPSVPSLDDVFARLLRLSYTQTLSTDGPSDSSVLASQINSRGGRSGNRGQRPQCTYCNKLGHTRDRCYHYMDGLLALPTLLSHFILCYLDLTPLRAPHLRVSPLLSPSLGPWILDSGASDHISANGSQTMLKDWSTGKTIGIGRESQGLYHLTSPSSPAACISTDAPLLIHSRLGHPSLSKFQKMVPRFSTLSSLACESCQLGKHTRVSFPKRLNNRDKLSAKAMKCIFLGYSQLQKAIVVIPLTLIVIFSPLMSPSLRTLHSSYPLNLFPFLKYCHFPIYPPLRCALSSSSVYHHRHCAVAPPLSSAEVPDDSPPVPLFLLPDPVIY
ncbi:hypothetical protein CK203_073771 [Vitis vinifera]|uniref:GAG-pre-integrase domain-containing protein n=1 Tax=Vitis vinifera TaxID=29760 RepID=A0A438DJH0_VITVI|nr:hypothetical protein CK203_073771 [Vitis vinifera]